MTNKPNWVEHASVFAKAVHRKQIRKLSGDPYWFHLQRVAKTVEDYNLGEYMICAAWLHDTIEDTGVTEEQLRATFPDEIVDLVVEMTDVVQKKDGNRAFRHKLKLARLATISDNGQTLKLADRIDNFDDYLKDDPDYLEAVYGPETEDLLKVLNRGDIRLQKLLGEKIEAFKNDRRNSRE